MLRTSTPPSRSGRRGAVPGLPEPDLDAALKRAMELMAIPGPSGQEAAVAEYVVEQLRAAGAPAETICYDAAHRKTPLAGEIGNLICQLPGTRRAPRRLLMAHLDTVPLCVGARPQRRRNVVESADKQTGLGADDRAGVAVVLTAALEVLRRGLDHPPLTFFWPIQEEVGLYGARYVRLAALGKPRLAFNWDGSAAEKVIVGATGAYRLRIEVQGIASHAGAAPERGVSAVAIAALAIADLQRGGWHGDVRKGRRTGTSNIGYVHGGGPTNVVTDRVELRAEARSHDPEFRREIVAAIQRAFEHAAEHVTSSLGERGQVRITIQQDYESFQLAKDEPCVTAAQAAVRAVGAEPLVAITNGGLDANWMTARGIPTVTLGCGQQNPHTVAERLDVPAFERACRIGLLLATGSERGERGASAP